MTFLVFLLFICTTIKSQTTYTIGHIFFHPENSTSVECSLSAPPTWIQATVENKCYGGGPLPRRILTPNATGISVQYYSDKCETPTNETRFFPFGECGSEPWDIFPGTGNLSFLAISFNISRFPPLPLDTIPPALNGQPDAPSLVRFLYQNTECSEFPSSVSYLRENECTAVQGTTKVSPSISICDGENVIVTTYSDQQCSQGGSTVTIPNGICIPAIDSTTFFDFCTFPTLNETAVSSENSDLALIISLSTAIPSCLIFAILVGVIVLILRIKTQKEVFDLGGIPIISKMTILNEIGSGNFGTVWKGQKGKDFYALKTVDRNEISNFIGEMELMINLDHENIVNFFGVYLQGLSTIYMVLEFMECGDLLKVLRQDSEIPHSLLLQFCKNVSHGMEYLHSKKIIHRDLACRNLLVTIRNTEYLCKVSNFGLSRTIEDEYNSSSRKNIPVRWTSPEALQFSTYTESNDVWSFGIVMWEIYSRGVVPYVGLKNEEVIERVNAGGTLLPPQGCPEEIYRIMKEIWKLDPKIRPTFEDISKRLSKVNQKKGYLGLVSRTSSNMSLSNSTTPKSKEFASSNSENEQLTEYSVQPPNIYGNKELLSVPNTSPPETEYSANNLYGNRFLDENEKSSTGEINNMYGNKMDDNNSIYSPSIQADPNQLKYVEIEKENLKLKNRNHKLKKEKKSLKKKTKKLENEAEELRKETEDLRNETKKLKKTIEILEKKVENKEE